MVNPPLSAGGRSHAGLTVLGAQNAIRNIARRTS